MGAQISKIMLQEVSLYAPNAEELLRLKPLFQKLHLLIQQLMVSSLTQELDRALYLEEVSTFLNLTHEIYRTRIQSGPKRIKTVQSLQDH